MKDRRPLRRRGGALAVTVVSVLGAAGAAAPVAGVAVTAARVAPVPAISGHVSTRTLSFPPDTAYCQAHFGISCYQPAQFQAAYDLKPLFDRGITGAGKTIVIVDAFGSPTIRDDLKKFDATFGLPDPPKLTIIQPAGPVTVDLTSSDQQGWAQETSLDVEWSHVMAPGANILLVETPVSETEGVTGFPEIVKAEKYVIDHHLGDVISQSFGATEQTFPSKQALLDLRGAYKDAQQHHVTVLGASGDQGATDFKLDLSCCYDQPVTSWPASDPLVTSIGGTMLHLDAAGKRTAPDEVWNDGFGAGGGGRSVIFGRPAFQNDQAAVVGDARGVPDISLSAAVDGAVVYYTGFNFTFDGSSKPGYHLVGGTSEATPLFAGVVALADQLAGHDLGLLNTRLYRLGDHAAANGIVDVTVGNNSFTFQNAEGTNVTVTGFQATPGYDLASGLGTVDAAVFVPALAASRG